MASLTTKILSAALVATGASALSFAMPAAAQQAGAQVPGGGWAKYCNKEEDVDICNVQIELRAWF